MRLHPTLPTLSRMTMRDYKLPGYDHVVPKGTPIVISVSETHKDPEHFPRADEFVPERFEPGSNMLNDHAFMPFGAG